ncbi:hypothetical protein ACHWQZ_G009564 [Mnemiopsis leidyi]
MSEKEIRPPRPPAIKRTGQSTNKNLGHARTQILSEQKKYNKNRNSTPRVLQGFNHSKPKTAEELRIARLKKFETSS